ncbi:hypothetical protein, partial [Chryseobacterium sp. SIMBA_029]|uniref:hypothetical protein n=1 Tax=Chryseobacterium sp. SIMBA_029 TaxID=3085772 RepID=UPI00397987D3
ADLLFCPVGVGKHVDHLITRGMGAGYPEKLVLYSDFPYDLASNPDHARLASMQYQPWTWSTGLEEKQPRIRQYATQVDALFPAGVIP